MSQKNLNNFFLTCAKPFIPFPDKISHKIIEARLDSTLFSDPNQYLLILEENLIGCFITKANLECFQNLGKFIDKSFKQDTRIIRLPNKILPYLESAFLELPIWIKNPVDKWSIQERRVAIELDPSICGLDDECVSEQFIRINCISECKNCRCGFDERDNTSSSCQFHPKLSKTLYGQEKVYFECCGHICDGSNNVFNGCVMGYHIKK